MTAFLNPYPYLINEFWQLREQVQFSSLEVDLYYALMQISNRIHWLNPFKKTNAHLMLLINISKEASLINARNKLQQHGLIRFKSGKKGDASEYTLVHLENYKEIHLPKVSKKGSENGSKKGSEKGSETVRHNNTNNYNNNINNISNNLTKEGLEKNVEKTTSLHSVKKAPPVAPPPPKVYGEQEMRREIRNYQGGSFLGRLILENNSAEDFIDEFVGLHADNTPFNDLRHLANKFQQEFRAKVKGAKATRVYQPSTPQDKPQKKGANEFLQQTMSGLEKLRKIQEERDKVNANHYDTTDY